MRIKLNTLQGFDGVHQRKINLTLKNSRTKKLDCLEKNLSLVPVKFITFLHEGMIIPSDISFLQRLRNSLSQ